MKMRAGLYARISEQDEKVAKVDNQLIDCRALVTSQGYEPTDEYPDDGISATTGKVRKHFERLLRDVEAGRIDVIVAVDEDRLSRRMEDTLRLQATCAATGTIWHTVRGGVVDPAKAQGEAFSQIRAVMSRLEVRQKVDRQKAANHHRRMAGKPLTGTRPFGFEKDRITHRPDEAKEIAWAYATVISTGKLYPILKRWNDEGIATSRGNKWSYATLQQLLRRASNAGLVEHEGEVLEDVQALWQGFVTREEWQTVVAILSDPQRRITPSREPKHLAAGLITCGTCGSVMRSSGSTNKPGEKIYRCATKISAQGDGRRHVSIKTTDLDPLITKAIVDTFFVSSPGSLPSHAEAEADFPKMHARLAEVRQGIQDLLDSIGQPGYTKARVDSAVAKLSTEEQQLTEQFEQSARESAHAAMMVDTFELMGNGATWEDGGKHKAALTKRFESLDLEQRRTLLRTLLRVTIYPGRTLDERVNIEHVGAPELDVEGDA